jgi:hypothetical protein
MITLIKGRPKKLKGMQPALVTKEKDYIYPRIEFYVQDNDLYIFFRSSSAKVTPSRWAKISDYSRYTALEIIQKYDLGRHFNDGILKLWNEGELNLGFLRKHMRSPWEVLK